MKGMTYLPVFLAQYVPFPLFIYSFIYYLLSG